jgi:hypothetical protein
MHTRPGVVKATAGPVWIDKGWLKISATTYAGYFDVPGRGRWSGKVKMGSTGFLGTYILNPPVVVRNHEKWHCFSHQGDGWYNVHMAKKPRTIDEAILNVERILNEAYRRGGRNV